MGPTAQRPYVTTRRPSPKKSAKGEAHGCRGGYVCSLKTKGMISFWQISMTERARCYARRTLRPLPAQENLHARPLVNRRSKTRTAAVVIMGIRASQLLQHGRRGRPRSVLVAWDSGKPGTWGNIDSQRGRRNSTSTGVDPLLVAITFGKVRSECSITAAWRKGARRRRTFPRR